MLAKLALLVANLGLLCGAGFLLNSQLRLLSLVTGAGLATLLCWSDISRGLQVEDRVPASPVQRLLCFATGLAVLGVFATAIAFADFGNTGFLIPSGIVVAAIGATIRRSSIITLGSEFVSDTQPADSFVAHGPYSMVRHPSELGLLLVCSGAAIANGSLVSAIAVFLLLVPLSYVRVLLEEQNLRAQFGEAYDRYASRTGMYLPRLDVS